MGPWRNWDKLYISLVVLAHLAGLTPFFQMPVAVAQVALEKAAVEEAAVDPAPEQYAAKPASVLHLVTEPKNPGDQASLLAGSSSEIPDIARIETEIFFTHSGEETEQVLGWLKDVLRENEKAGNTTSVQIVTQDNPSPQIYRVADVLKVAPGDIAKVGLDCTQCGTFLEYLGEKVENDSADARREERIVAKNLSHYLVNRFASHPTFSRVTFALVRTFFVGGAVTLSLVASNLDPGVSALGGALLGAISGGFNFWAKMYLSWLDRKGSTYQGLMWVFNQPAVKAFVATLSKMTGRADSVQSGLALWKGWLKGRGPEIVQSYIKFAATEVMVLAGLAYFMNAAGAPMVPWPESGNVFEFVAAHSFPVLSATLSALLTQGVWDSANSAQRAKRLDRLAHEIKGLYEQTKDLRHTALYYLEEKRMIEFKSSWMLIAVAFVANATAVALIPDNLAINMASWAATIGLSGLGVVYQNMVHREGGPHHDSGLIDNVKRVAKTVGNTCRQFLAGSLSQTEP